MAVYGFRGIGWFLSGVSVALGGYMVTSNGAAERARLQQVEGRIVAAKKEIRDLETEYNTRANMAQLDQWNVQGLGLAAPASQQFADEAQLAHLDTMGAPAGQQLASLTVPAAPAIPAPAAAAAAPQPVAATASAGRVAVLRQLPVETAQNASGGLRKPRVQKVAMLDDRVLSASTISDLQARAAAEQLKLR